MITKYLTEISFLAIFNENPHQEHLLSFTHYLLLTSHRFSLLYQFESALVMTFLVISCTFSYSLVYLFLFYSPHHDDFIFVVLTLSDSLSGTFL